MNHNHGKSDGHHHHHDETLYEELVHHFPYAVFSVAFGLSLLSFLTPLYFTAGQDAFGHTSHVLFHSFHFMHIVFAATGTIITFYRFSSNTFQALLVGILSPSIFCMLSDVVLPYIAGILLGVDMHFHMCFASELPNVLPFLFVGILNGFIMSRHNIHRQGFYSVFSHAIHILVSSLASIFYLVSHGFVDWYAQIGIVFLFLIVAVVVPCTLSDVVVPMTFARLGRGK